MVFDTIDVDKDGHVTFDEVCGFVRDPRKSSCDVLRGCVCLQMYSALIEMGVDYTSAQKFSNEMIGTKSPDQNVTFEAFKRVFANLSADTEAAEEPVAIPNPRASVPDLSFGSNEFFVDTGSSTSTPVGLEAALNLPEDAFSSPARQRSLSNGSSSDSDSGKVSHPVVSVTADSTYSVRRRLHLRCCV